MNLNLIHFLFYRAYDIIGRYFRKPVVCSISVAIVDPVAMFVKQRQDRLLRTYDNKIDMNVNIDPVFYDNTRFSELTKMSDNPLEKRWKKCLLYESTPRGNIFMFYDVYKSGFAYYADQNCVPYAILNAMAMKYVVVFFCRDFFMDESVITELSRLREREPATKKTDKVANSQMAKLKNYKDIEKIPVVIRNKFISLGKTYNLKLIQTKSKIPVLGSDSGPGKFDAMFSKPAMSYKDFKALTAAI